MSTRTARSRRSAGQQATVNNKTIAEPQEQAVSDNPSVVGSFGESALKAPSQTIGSRLRKRRRTDSPPFEDISPAPKRTQSKKADSAVRWRGQAGSPGQDDSTTTNTAAPQSPQQTTDAANVFERDMQTPNGQSHAMQPIPLSEDSTVQGQEGPDFHTVIADIINHGETVDSHYDSRGHNTMAMGQNGHLGASYTLKTQSLPVLENLATQILEIMAKSTYHEILSIATKPDTDPGQAYETLKSLFDHAKKVYSVQEPFLNPYELGLVDNVQIEIIRKANMATFVSSVFGSQDVGFYHLNENFIDTFVPDSGRLLKSQAQLYLDLKTQAYISAVQHTDRSREEILEDLFPQDLEDRLMKRRPGTKKLAPSESEFVLRAENRRKALLDEASNQVAIRKLPEKYVWEDFLRDVSAYVSKNFEAIAGVSHPQQAILQPPQLQQQRSQQRIVQKKAAHRSPQPQQPAQYNGTPFSTQFPIPQPSARATTEKESAEREVQAAHHAMQNMSTDQDHVTPSQYQHQTQPPSDTQEGGPSQPPIQNPPQIQYHFEQPLHPNVPAPPPPFAYNSPRQQYPYPPTPPHIHPTFTDQIIPYPTQSAPTQILYERARQAATAKSTPATPRRGVGPHPSQRRPWTTEEESCLMAGLDRVKGPHWSQILAMFGPGGTVSEVLKGRNQVQLKDKARNLKLFFLKSGIEVPYYLQFVTGELKTRVAGWKRRMEEERGEGEGEGDAEGVRRHVEGLMTLAGGRVGDGIVGGDGVASGGKARVADMGVGSGGVGEGGLLDPRVTNAADGAYHSVPNGNGVGDGNADGTLHSVVDGVV